MFGRAPIKCNEKHCVGSHCTYNHGFYGNERCEKCYQIGVNYQIENGWPEKRDQIFEAMRITIRELADNNKITLDNKKDWPCNMINDLVNKIIAKKISIKSF